MNQSKFPPRLVAQHHNLEAGESFWTAVERRRLFKWEEKYYTEEYISTTEHNHLISQLEERLRVAESKLKRFSVYGTDGCSGCETGRVTLFIANKECIQCDPKSYESLAAIKEKKE